MKHLHYAHQKRRAQVEREGVGLLLMGSGSSKLTSWVAVAAVKAGQTGPCRWNHAIRTVQQQVKSSGLRQSHAGTANKSTTTTVNQARRLSGAIDHSGVASVRTAREAEKAENVMHLVCWGPR